MDLNKKDEGEMDRIIAVTFEGDTKRCKIYLTKRELKELMYISRVFSKPAIPGTPSGDNLREFIIKNV